MTRMRKTATAASCKTTDKKNAERGSVTTNPARTGKEELIGQKFM